MENLTPRQVQILKNIVEEYTETAAPVGSDVLEKKYNLGVSPATIRNEMVVLTKAGYLKQPHTSAGRVPTPRAIKLYVDQLMEEKKLSVAEEVQAREKALSVGEDFDRLMHEVTKSLAAQTHALAVAATEGEDIWHAGYSNILDIPEFYNIDVTSQVFSLLEEVNRIHELFFEKASWERQVEVLFGEELGWPNFEPVGVVACQFESPQGKGSLGVVGAARFDYPVVVPTVRYFGELLTQLSQEWQEK